MKDLPPIYMINLDRSFDRLQRFKKCNSQLGNIIRVSAADGNSLDREELVRSRHIDHDLPYSAGALGCAVSHVRLWEMAATRNQSITIFEDDIVVSGQFEKRAQELLETLPDDWDIIQWGYVFNPLFLWIDLGMSKARLQGYGTKRYSGAVGYHEFQTEELRPAAVRLLHSFGTQGYSISAKGARAALEHCLPLRQRDIVFPDAGVTTPDNGIDVALCGLYPKLQAFICIPQLVLHDEEQLSDRKSIDGEAEITCA